MRALLILPMIPLLIAGPALAEKSSIQEKVAKAAPLTVTVDAIGKSGRISKEYAQCIPTAEGKSTKGENLRPAVKWEGGPVDAKSYAIVVHDPDVPADLSIANDEELLIADDFPRQTFYHWVQFNIGADVSEVPGGTMPPGFGRTAANDVSKGNYKLGYGGPCPPWNDAVAHRYIFTVHALDVPKLKLMEGVPARDAVKLIEAHSIAKGAVVGSFTNNPALRKGTKL